MFEQPKISKKLKQQLSKVLSIALSVAMLAGTIPADMLGGIASVSAEEASSTTLSASNFQHEDGDSTINNDNGTAFTVTNVTAKADGESGTADHFELTSDSIIAFTVIPDKTGTLSISLEDGDGDKAKLTLTKDSENPIESLDSKLESGSYELKASDTVKLQSITLTLEDVEGAGDGPADVPLTVNVTDSSDGLLQDTDTFTFEPGENEFDATTKTVNYDSNGSMSVELKEGVDYTLSCNNDKVEVTAVVGEQGEGSNTVTVSSGDESITITVTAKEPVEEETTYTLSGSISFTDSEGTKLENADETKAFEDLGSNSITFVPVENAEEEPDVEEAADPEDDGQETAQTVIATVDKSQKNYTAKLDSDTTYKLVVVDESEKYEEVTIASVNKDEIKLDADKQDANITLKLVAGDDEGGEGDDGDATLAETHTFNAIDLKDSTGNAYGDKAVIIDTLGASKAFPSKLNDTTSEDDFFTGKVLGMAEQTADKSTVGSLVYRTGSSGSVELSKSYSGGIEFSVDGNYANVTIKAASTGGTNWSKIGIQKAGSNDVIYANVSDASKENGTLPEKEEDAEGHDLKQDVYGTSLTTLTYEKLVAGTYYVVVPTSDRGARVNNIKVEVYRTESYKPHKGVHEFESKNLEIFTNTSGNESNRKSDVVADYFTAQYGETSKTEDRGSGNNKQFKNKDGEVIYESQVRLNFGGNAETTQNSIKFTTLYPATVEVFWIAAQNNRHIQILDSDGNQVAYTIGTTVKDELYVSTLYLTKAGTYYLGCFEGSNYLYRVLVDEGSVPERAAWGEVAAPTINFGDIKVNDTDKTKIDVKVTANVGYDGGDKVTVALLDEEGMPLMNAAGDPNEASSVAESQEATLTLTPGASGNYKFKAKLSREGEEEVKESDITDAFEFKLPLEDVEITSVTSKGLVEGTDSGSILVKWTKVPEATKYVMQITEKNNASAAAAPLADEEGEDETEEVDSDTTDEETGVRTIVITDGNASSKRITSGLTVGKTYIVSLTAYRNDEASATDTWDEGVEITAQDNVIWYFDAFGDGTTVATNKVYNTASNGFTAGSAYNTGVTAANPKGLNFTDEAVINADGSLTLKSGGDGEADRPVENPNDVRIWSENGAGKITDSDTMGIDFYYTAIEPSDTNFKLSAYAHINRMAVNGAQEGFGLMASDRVSHDQYMGKSFWTNLYLAGATKVKYRWDADNNRVEYDNEEWAQYEMRDGLGAVEIKGVSAATLPLFEDTATQAATKNKYYKKTTYTLDTTKRDQIGGQYTILHYTPAAENLLPDTDITDVKLNLELSNTGYYISYTKLIDNGDGTFTEGETTGYQYYDRDALSKIEEDSVYVGFFASRDADVTFYNVSFSTSDCANDPPAETQPVTYVTPSYSITSGSTANKSDYTLIFSANWEGKVTIKDQNGKELVPGGKYMYTELTPETSDPVWEERDADGIIKDKYDEETGYKQKYNLVKVDLKGSDALKIGTNEFTWTFEPTPLEGTEENPGYNPDANPDYETDKTQPIGFTQLSDYSKKTGTFTVTYKKYGVEGDAIYVSPNGTALGDGTPSNPLDLLTAVKYVQPGQVIYLMEGKTGGIYRFNTGFTINRGINGTAEKRIYMLPAPGSTKRPVLDFQDVGSGMTLAGNYWYIKDIDMIRCLNGQKAIQVSGSYNVIDQCNFYKNGGTGLQISRLGGSDTTMADWPSYNLILNCSSFNNADRGFQDADGFGAKLNIGPGNIFDGCIAAYNADDGWDFFAKSDYGQIGTVVIQNCIAYKNGYVLLKDTSDLNKLGNNLDMNGTEVEAGNGNGFKMGGNSIPGPHILKNSIAFYNGAKGIDSNNGPDIQAYDSVSFNNVGANVNFSTGAATTNYKASRVISYRTEHTSQSESIKLLPPQNVVGSKEYEQVYNDTNYYWDTSEKKSISAGASKKEADIANWFINATSAGFEEFDRGVASNIEDRCINIGDFYVRNEDGSIDMHGFLILTDKATEDIEITKFGEGKSEGRGTVSSDDVTVPEGDNAADATDGNISSGNAGDESSNGILPEDQEKFGDISSGVTDVGQIGLWFNIVDPELITYTGKAIKPEVHVYDGTTLLTKKDYTITFKNNVNAWEEGRSDNLKNDKVPTITVRGKGNYIGLADVRTFEIHPVSIEEGEDALNRVSAADIVVITDKGSSKITPVVTFNTKKLTRNKDITYNDVSGTPESVTVTGTGNFTGTRDIRIRYTTQAEYKANSAASFKVDKILEQRPAGFEDYEQTKPIPVELSTEGSNAVLKVSDKNKTPLTCVEENSGEDGYSVSYRNNIGAGTATVIIKGEGKYYGTKEVKFRIVPTKLNTLVSKKLISIYQEEVSDDGTVKKKEFDFKNAKYDFDGETIKIFEKEGLKIDVSDENGNVTKLRKGVDYTLTYRNNSKAGTASVVIKGIGNYGGSINKTFKINVFNLNDLQPNDNAKLVLEGSTIDVVDGKFVIPDKVDFAKGGSRPNIVLYINGNRMDGQYTVTYKNNTMAAAAKKAPTVIITGRGGLKGKLEATFEIQQKQLSDADVTITADDVKVSKKSGNGYTGNLVSRIVIKDANGKALSAGTDYDKNTITYEIVDNDDIPGRGVNKQPGSVDKIKDNPNKYTATVDSADATIKVKVTVKALEGSSSKAQNCGYKGEISGYFHVGYAKQSVSSAKVVVNYDTQVGASGRKTYFDYTGSEIRLYDLDSNSVWHNTLTVTLGGKPLVYDQDFELVKDADGRVVYINNINKGTATVYIRGKGNYSGTKVVKYRIGAKVFEWMPESGASGKASNAVNTGYNLEATIPGYKSNDGDGKND